MNEIIENALNRGAPIDTPIMIDIYEFIRLFDSEKLVEEYRKSVEEIVSKISNIIDMYGGSIILPTYVTISMDENNNKVLCFSRENYFFSIFGLLQGMKLEEIERIFDARENFESLKEKVLSIKTEDELKGKLPRVYELYIDQLEANNNFLELEELLNDKSAPLNIKLENLSRITNSFKRLYSDFDLEREQEFARRFTLTAYLKRLMQVVENMLDHFDEIVAIYDNHTLDLNVFNKEDADRLNLYMAAKFMKEVEREDVSDKQRYLFYLTNYFRENVETQITRVKMKLDGCKTTPIILYERYKKLLVDNPDLLAVNFSYHDFKDMKKEEVEEFIVAYLAELSANWELIPSDDTSVEKSVRTIAKRKYRNISEEERKQKEEKLVNLYMQKKKFYDSTDPYFRIKGKQTFDGYVGYIYQNALVVLEKFYDNAKNSKIADNEAIYIIGMRDFYELSQHSKSYLIANHLCKRVIHKGLWQEKVLEYINKKNTGYTPVADTNQLISENKLFVKEKKL